MIRQVYDASEIDYLLNDPLIRPTIGGDGLLTVFELISDERNVFIVDGDNGAAFLWSGPGVYEGHSFFKSRGKDAIDLGKKMIESMAGQANLIWGTTPVRLKAARWFNRKIGFRSLGFMDVPELGRCELFEKRF